MNRPRLAFLLVGSVLLTALGGCGNPPGESGPPDRLAQGIGVTESASAEGAASCAFRPVAAENPVEGAGLLGACSATRLDCDRNPENGCETDSASDRFQCGACGNACPPGAACIGGVCGAACPSLQADCDDNRANGCESKSAPLAYWRMNEGTLLSVADSAGYAGPLRLDDSAAAPSFIPAAPPGTTPGGYALHCQFAGRICARSANLLTLPVSTQFTVQAWVRYTDASGGFLSLSSYPSHAVFLSMLQDSVGNLAGSMWGNDNLAYSLTAPSTATTMKDGRWHLLAFTADGSNMRLFLDGTQVASRNIPYAAPRPLRTGTVQLVNVTRGDVDIDEVKIYGYARSATEIESDTLTFCRAPTTCGTSCTAPAHAVPKCDGARCSFTCLPGWADCDGNATNGCEIDLSNSVGNCGGCGNVCSGGAAARCKNGFCSECRCAAGTANCNGDCSDSCETNTASDASNCGACGRTCVLPHATASCTTGACAVARCEPGWGDCDGKPANGCESDLTRDLSNCGACGKGCASGSLCAAGTCEAAMCGASIRDCDGKAANGCETDVNADPLNCGACGRACRTAPNEQTSCSAGGLCSLSCNPGWGDCDGNLTNGCESDLLRDPTHCGSCTQACKVAHASAACGPGGTCVVGRCDTGWRQCGRACVAMYDPNACGPSCKTCPKPPHAYATCDSNYCGFVCEAGYHDCDGNPTNGCESLSEPVAWWRMNEGYERTIADSSRAGVAASIRGYDDRWSAASPPGFPQGMSIMCNDGSSSDGGRCLEALMRWQWNWPFTVQAWIRTSKATATVDVVNISSHVKLSILTDGRVASMTEKTVTGTTNVLDGAWHHLAITGDGTSTRVYVDGFLEGSGAYTSTRPGFDPATVSIGSQLRGEIDEVKIYNYARTITEIEDDSLTFCRAP